MKKITSLLLAVVLLATMFTVFAVPASAEGETIECVPTDGTVNITSRGDYIIKQDCKLTTLNVSAKSCTLTIPEGVTVTVTQQVSILSGKVILNGKLDASKCPSYIDGNNINIGETGTLVKGKGIDYRGKESYIPIYMTTLSEGNIWIIIAIAVVVIAGVVTLVVVKKKKKPAVASGENKDEE